MSEKTRGSSALRCFTSKRLPISRSGVRARVGIPEDGLYAALFIKNASLGIT
jgi:hypothetical protein